MKTRIRSYLFGLMILALAGAGSMPGCENASQREEVQPKNKPANKEKAAESKKVAVGKNISLEVLPNKKRRVLVSAEVCLREGQLELLMCRKQTKEHESILTADVDARKIHETLLLAGAEAGSPVRFVPKYRPASGTTIKISVQYQDKDKQKTVPAKSWLKNAKTNKLLESDWIFAGSRLVTNPLDPDGKKHYLANDGDVICVSNFETALLDLPIKSPKENADLLFLANTERIPPLGTKVVVILEPVLKEKKDK